MEINHYRYSCQREVYVEGVLDYSWLGANLLTLTNTSVVWISTSMAWYEALKVVQVVFMRAWMDDLSARATV